MIVSLVYPSKTHLCYLVIVNCIRIPDRISHRSAYCSRSNRSFKVSRADGHLSTTPPPPLSSVYSSSFPAISLVLYLGILIVFSVEIYMRMSTDLLPTPAKSHYIFNLRDLSKCIQGKIPIINTSAYMHGLKREEALGKNIMFPINVCQCHLEKRCCGNKICFLGRIIAKAFCLHKQSFHTFPSFPRNWSIMIWKGMEGFLPALITFCRVLVWLSQWLYSCYCNSHYYISNYCSVWCVAISLCL